MTRSRLLSIVVAAPLALLLLSCDGGGGGGSHWNPPSGPRGGDGVVSVRVPGGVGFNGFDIWVTYDATKMTPLTPLASHVVASGVAAGSTCLPQQSGNTLRLSCAKATAMAGPAEVAVFGFHYPSSLPTTADFDVDCDFWDEDGYPVALSCSSVYVD
jgi:hypothetical protein